MLKCRSCGCELSPNSRFCSACGGSLDAESIETVAVATTLTPSVSGNQSRFLPGALIAERYRIVALLGRGGMGEVYRADDLTLGQPVALKFLPEAVVHDETVLARFRSEVRVARQVSHPNVCRVYDVGEVEGQFFLSMEYVDGEDLGSLLRRIGRLPEDKALEIARRLCAGLAAAHEKGVLHRDLKPSNVMLDGRGHVLLTDFGLAGLADQVQGAEVRNGTPAYMAPEQLSGKEVTVKSDIYSLGLVLYEIFTGKRPFEAETLADLLRVRTQNTPTNPSTLVRDLDPAVERIILRCLEPDPAQRPASALAVAAALPGGDPLAAALAAGETPSPQMVAAAGEGTGLSARVAIPVFAAAMLGLIVNAVLINRSSALEQMRLEYSPEVLFQKSREIVQRLGYNANPVDDAYGFLWEGQFIREVEQKDKPIPHWSEIVSQRPSLLRFWYRQSDSPMIADGFTDDLLTPGMVTPGDEPPPIESGMIDLALDSQGHLISFHAMPAQLQKPGGQVQPMDWSVLFAAAGLDQEKLQPTEPLWNSLSSSDTRIAWTGTWPGTSRPLRVEAAAWRGKPVVFDLIGPWTKPDRMPLPPAEANRWIKVGVLLSIVCAAAVLARRNYRQGKGDRRGAFRLASWMVCVQIALWVLRTHFVAAMGTIAEFILAIATALLLSGLVWTFYLAVEPYVRRYWPQTIISWSRVLAGHVRDPIVGRDVLFGVGLGVVWALIYQIRYLLMAPLGVSPAQPSTDFLVGARRALGAWLMHVPYSVRGTLSFFFLLFFLRALLRNQWLASAVFVLIWSSIKFLGSSYPSIEVPAQVLIFTIAAIFVLRFGLVALAVGIFVVDVLLNVPVTVHGSAWYLGSTVFVLATVVALAAWGFHASMAGRRLWKQDLFE
jgi:uncharacterized OB-fold protein